MNQLNPVQAEIDRRESAPMTKQQLIDARRDDNFRKLQQWRLQGRLYYIGTAGLYIAQV